MQQNAQTEADKIEQEKSVNYWLCRTNKTEYSRISILVL